MKLPSGRPAPPGAAIFLDPQEGWLWTATEAAGHKTSLYEPDLWPVIARRDIPDSLGAGGVTFVWLQEPDPGGATPRLLAKYFLEAEGRLLVAGDSPADLEPLADLPGALFPGEAGPGSPLNQAALGVRIDRQRMAREARLAEINRELAEIKNAEAAQRARLNLWTDLDDLEGRFKEMGRDLAAKEREWAGVRAAASEQEAVWASAARKAERLPKFTGWCGRLLNWFLVRSRNKAEEESRRALEAAEAAVRVVRLAEEEAWTKARNFSERLGRMRRESETWPARTDLAAELERLTGAKKLAAQTLENIPPLLEPDQLLAEAPLLLALAADLANLDRLFPAVLRLTSIRPDPDGRQALSALVLKAEKHLVIVGDFTFWPVWSGRASSLPEASEGPAWKGPAWKGIKVAEEESELKEYLAAGGLFRPAPPPALAPRLTRLELGDPWAAVGLRALGEMGPVNPVSALAAARAALSFARNRRENPAVLILTASPAQGRLIDLMLQDLEAPRIFAGEPQAFDGGPRAPLVILEPAFEAPHRGHPWAWPSFGRWRLQLAWSLAREEIWLAGRGAWLERLPKAAPLAALWRAAEAGPEVPTPAFEPQPDAVRRILDLARNEIWALLPTPKAAWWSFWEEPLVAAARRRLAVTVLCAPPEPDDDQDFASAALRKLGANNCSVGLASGFPGGLAVVDSRHLIWAEAYCWSLPLAAPLLAGLLQLKLIQEKVARRGGTLKTCRLCGRALVLINQSQLRGLGDEQPLQVGCLGCPPQNRQRLDERRDPFNAPPRCGQDRLTLYQRLHQGRQEVWVCPRHPGGPLCPTFRVIPGDIV